MRIWSNAVIAELRVSNCAECPEHKKVQIRRKTPTGWMTETSHVSCRKTGRNVTLMGIGDGCPLPVYLTTEKAEKAEDKEKANERTD